MVPSSITTTTTASTTTPGADSSAFDSGVSIDMNTMEEFLRQGRDVNPLAVAALSQNGPVTAAAAGGPSAPPTSPLLASTGSNVLQSAGGTSPNGNRNETPRPPPPHLRWMKAEQQLIQALSAGGPRRMLAQSYRTAAGGEGGGTSSYRGATLSPGPAPSSAPVSPVHPSTSPSAAPTPGKGTAAAVPPPIRTADLHTESNQSRAAEAHYTGASYGYATGDGGEGATNRGGGEPHYDAGDGYADHHPPHSHLHNAPSSSLPQLIANASFPSASVVDGTARRSPTGSDVGSSAAAGRITPSAGVVPASSSTRLQQQQPPAATTIAESGSLIWNSPNISRSAVGLFRQSVTGSDGSQVNLGASSVLHGQQRLVALENMERAEVAAVLQAARRSRDEALLLATDEGTGDALDVAAAGSDDDEDDEERRKSSAAAAGNGGGPRTPHGPADGQHEDDTPFPSRQLTEETTTGDQGGGTKTSGEEKGRRTVAEDEARQSVKVALRYRHKATKTRRLGGRTVLASTEPPSKAAIDYGACFQPWNHRYQSLLEQPCLSTQDAHRRTRAGCPPPHARTVSRQLTISGNSGKKHD